MTQELAIKKIKKLRETSKARNILKSGLCNWCSKLFFTPFYWTIHCSRKCVDAAQTGSNNLMWKGGRLIVKSGYVWVWAKDHPKARKGNPYVREHVLVMEKHLGRYLKLGENIHHKNGIKDDNSLSNLELWTSYQVPGQRVEDLIDFIAKEYPNEIRKRLRELKA